MTEEDILEELDGDIRLALVEAAEALGQMAGRPPHDWQPEAERGMILAKARKTLDDVDAFEKKCRAKREREAT